jgi:DNA adenine methylase
MNTIDQNVKPFLKWVGGKTQLIKDITNHIPDNFNNYLEPFLGGGAVLFHILNNYTPKKVLVSDINYELINTYKVIKNNVLDLIDILEDYKKKHNKNFYYSIRGLDTITTKKMGLVLRDPNFNSLERAARFIYLNKTCFNGLYRVNKDNKFNVPIGSYKNPSIYNKKNLIYISNLLQNVEFKICSFEDILEYVKKKDFVYLDPPYDKLEVNSFTSYTKDDFSRTDQIKLKTFCDKLSFKKAQFLESNVSTEFIINLYSNYNISEVNAKRLVNSNASKRGFVKELLIKNY